MKKINSLVLSTLTAALLIGCGGGSSSTNSSTTTTASATDVTVERGAIWGATVTDSSTPVQTATQTSATSNVYTFANTPVYPVMATGGIIDLDGDATTTDDVYDFTDKTLTSYSEVITPITDYLGSPSDSTYQTKLTKLKELTGSTDDDLLKKVPSSVSSSVLVLTNSLYNLLNDNDDSNDDFLTDYDNSSFKTMFEASKSSIDDTLTLKENAKLLEEEVLSTLGITKLTSEEVASKISEIETELDDSSNNTSSTGTTTSAVSGKSIIAYDEYGYVQANFYANGTYKEVSPDEDSNGNPTGSTYTCTGKWLDFGNNKIGTTCEDNGTSVLPTGTVGGVNDEGILTLPSSSEVGSIIVVEDSTETFNVKIVNISDLSKAGSLTSIVSGKFIKASDSYGNVTAVFMEDGIYREYGTGDWSCNGQWRDFGNNKIATTCEDAGTTSVPTGIMNNNEGIILLQDSTPTAGEKIYSIDPEEIFELNIDEVSANYIN